MTIAEGCSILFDWFSKNDTFELDRDYKNLVIVSDDEYVSKEILKQACDKIEKNNLIKKLSLKPSREVWVLEESLDSYEQKVELQGQLACRISNIINKTCDVIGDYEDLCNPLAINEKDLNNLIFICEKLYEHSAEKKDA